MGGNLLPLSSENNFVHKLWIRKYDVYIQKLIDMFLPLQVDNTAKPMLVGEFSTTSGLKHCFLTQRRTLLLCAFALK
jgi:hypothetical protein